MAVYKVIQDIESEDKLLGPLGLRQLIYAGITAMLAFISFQILVTPQLGIFRAGLITLFVIPMVLFGVLAAPLGGHQSTENWLLARLRFFAKPQKRIWDQNGLKELVTITAPKREFHRYTDDLSQTEVRSRLRALASTLDSRGWAVKDPALNLYSQPGYLADGDSSDRLVSTSNMPQDVPTINIKAEDDILDAQSNATAQHFTQLMQQKEVEQKQRINRQMEQPQKADPTLSPEQQGQPDYWFMHQVEPPKQAGSDGMPLAVFQSTNVVTPGSSSDSSGLPASQKLPVAEEQHLLKQIHESKAERRKRLKSSHMKTILPIGEQETPQPHTVSTPITPQAQPEVTAPRQAAILDLANNSGDLSVSTVAGLAKHKLPKATDDEEVVISLR